MEYATNQDIASQTGRLGTGFASNTRLMLKHIATHEDRVWNRAPGMSAVADYTAPSLMVSLPRGRDAAALVAELCSMLHSQGLISDQESFYHAVLAHEKLSSTAMPPGWALPHARLAGIPRLSFVLGRTREPIAWFGGERVTTVFLCAVPEAEAGASLGLISGLARLSQDTARLRRLEDAPDSQAMFEVLQEIPLPGSPAPALNS